MSEIFIGTKVVCVDDSSCKTCGAKLAIVKNKIYVVAAVRTSRYGAIPMLDLISMTSECHGLKDNGYMAARFAPLEEIKKHGRSGERGART